MDRVNVFNNTLWRTRWENSVYRTWFQAMELGETNHWTNSPIMVGIAERGGDMEVVSVQPKAPNAKPDCRAEPTGVWELHRPYWLATLNRLATKDTIFFNTETTDTDAEMDEAVSRRGPPTFPLVRHTLLEIMVGTTDVCWITEFDFAFLDCLCIRYHPPLIPRNRVVCVMKKFPPLAGMWDEEHGALERTRRFIFSRRRSLN